MICEGFRPVGSFTNYGGSVTWIIKVSGAVTVQGQYQSGYYDIYQWWNDINGVPEIQALKLSS